MEDFYIGGHKVFDVEKALQELKDACYLWNCLCGKQDDTCDPDNKIYVGFNSDPDFWKKHTNRKLSEVFALVTGMEFLSLEGPGEGGTFNSESKCTSKEKVKIHFNTTKAFKYNDIDTVGDKEYRQFFINDEYITDELMEELSIIPAAVVSFIYVAAHEIGHALGLAHFGNCSNLKPPLNGVMNGNVLHTKEKFKGLSIDDKCAFAMLYCPELTNCYTNIFEYNPPNQKLYPNPTPHTVTIDFTLPKSYTHVTISIMNILGQVVLTPLENIPYEEGTHTEQINVSHLPNGTYTVIIQANEHLSAQSLIILKP